ncbi:hypothetical protein DL764_002429 [Monosporascus ibericus]|uniref:NmrA-like domain-containing protein n=1 Tax=Monosporascus ibericus TaxID=155417 RepID=A0A4Q4TM52_9PEZI|nr:hypothetical protein DL764_002429 [Monosporascus ibericus]
MVKALIIGATGKQGGATARYLLKAGHEVHALVRTPDSEAAQALKARGAVLFEGNTDDLDAIKAAMAGTSAVFWISLPSFTDWQEEVRGTKNIVDTAKQSGSVEHLIYSTVSMIEHIKEVPQWEANLFLKVYWENKIAGEERVRSAGLKYYTILRPHEFMSNLVLPSAAFQFPDMTSTGVWNSAFPPGFRNQYIDTEDVGRVATAALLNPEGWNGREVEIVAERVPVGEVVELVSAAAGKQLSLRTLGEEEALKASEQNPVLLGQLCRVKYAELHAEWDTQPIDDFGLGFKTLKQFLEENKELVVETYKNVQ